MVENTARSENAKKTTAEVIAMRSIMLLPSAAAAEAEFTPSSLALMIPAHAIAATRMATTMNMRTVTSLSACTDSTVKACSACCRPKGSVLVAVDVEDGVVGGE